MFGTGHSYVTALIALDPAVAQDWLAEQGRPTAPLAQLAHDDELIRAIALSIAFANRDLTPIERVKAFTVVGEEWVPGSSLMSADGEPNRPALAQRYASDLTAMFDNDVAAPPARPNTPAESAPVDPTLPPFVTPGAAAARPAPPVEPPARPAAGSGTTDPTPSYSAVLRPARPLAPKDPAADDAGSGSAYEGVTVVPAAGAATPGATRRFDSDDEPGNADDGAYPSNPADGGQPPADESLDWDATWPPERPPTRRWWWAVLLALVVVAAGAIVVNTMNNDSGGDESTLDTLVDDVYDTTPDSLYEDPLTTEIEIVDTTAAPAVADTLIQTIEKVPNLTTFLSVVKAVGLDVDLTGAQPITVLAPTDEAFNKLPGEVLDALLADKELLGRILRHHLVDGSIYAEDLTDGTITARDGTTILVATSGNVVFDQNVKPVDTDIPAANGVLHTIDSVLLPPGTDLTALMPTTTTLPAKLFFTVYFGTNARKLSDEAKAVIAEAAEAIKALPADSEVEVTGFSMNFGSAGSQRYNARLRANETIKALKRAGATNVRYKVVTVIRLPRSGDRAEARRTEIKLPGYVDPSSTSTSAPSGDTSTTMEP